MPTFDISWEAFGHATVEADSADEAEEVVLEGLMDWKGDTGWENNQVDSASAVEVWRTDD